MNKVFDSTMGKASAWPSWSKADQRELREFAKQYHDLMGRLVHARDKGDAKTAKRVAKQILCSFGAKVCVAVRAVKLAVVDGKVVGNAPSLAAIKEFAGTLNPYEFIPEPVFAKEIAKAGGELWPKEAGPAVPRTILRFEWRRRALLKLCDDILSVHYPAFANDYMAAGGTSAAIQHVLKQIEDGGFDHVVTIDIKGFFSSIDKRKVAELLATALPERVVQNAILIQDDVSIMGSAHDANPAGKTEGPHTQNAPYVIPAPNQWCAARQGIPQGSPASNRIAYSAILGPLLSTLPFADRIVFFGDDVIIPAKGALDGEEKLKAVMSLYATSPVGPLAIGRHAIRRIDDYFDFCGYRIRRLPPQWGGGWRLRPSPKAFRKWEEEAATRFSEAGGGWPGLWKVYRYTKSWIGSFPLWMPKLWGPNGSGQLFYIQLAIRLSAVPVYGPFQPLEETTLQSIGKKVAAP